MGTDQHDSDRQDFLERQEARQRRRQQQQKTSSAPLPNSPGTGRKATPRPASGQAPAAPSGQPASTGTGGQPTKARTAPPTGATPTPPSAETRMGDGPAQPAGKRDTTRQRTRTPSLPANQSASAGEPSQTSGSEGRRAGARRETLAGAAATAGEPRPSLLARTIIWGTVALCGLLLLASIGEAWNVHRLNQQVAASQQADDQLQSQNQALQQSIQNLQQPGTIEQEARQLGYIFPGDQPVVIVIGPSPSAPPAAQAPSSSPGFWGFWPDWLKLFFGG